jgi:SAM-dependent methyltransferase
MSVSHEDILRREKEFHEQRALEIDIEKIDVQKYFEGSTSPENRFILSRMGAIKNKSILDLGCGAGENSVYFALKQAKCIATDYSPLMVETALRLAKKYGVKIEGRVMNAMKIEYPDDSFDFVYASNLLHHVNPHQTLREMHRVLKRGGKACFWDPLKHNPVINIYRLIAKDARTEDEKPLDISILKFVRMLFPSVEYDTFWIISLLLLLRFFLVERVNPNKEHYWKKIILEEERLRSLYLKLERLDCIAKRLPSMQRFSWNIAVVATK